MSEEIMEFGKRPEMNQVNDEAEKTINHVSQMKQLKDQNQYQFAEQQIIPQIDGSIKPNSSSSAQEIIAKLKSRNKYEEVLLPSRSLTYEHIGLQPDQPINVRPMTMEEEKIISTPRLIKSGQAIDKILEGCIQEEFSSKQLLIPDRIFLLFYIRGISYGPEYSVQIQCPSCSSSFNEDINLSLLNVNYAPDGYRGIYNCTLPVSGLNVQYRMQIGEDDYILSRNKKVMTKNFNQTDSLEDAVIKKHVLLVQRIENIVNKIEIEQIINNLGVKDSSYLRSLISEYEFGIDTLLNMSCPYCMHEWELELPLDATFFFPKMKKTS